MNRHEPHALGTGCLNQAFLGNHIGMVAKAKIRIDHGGRFRGFNDFWRRGRIQLAAAEMFQVRVQVAEPHIADTLGLGVHDFVGNNNCLFITCSRAH